MAFAFHFYNPIHDFLTAPPQLHRTPLPQINTELLALEANRSGEASKCGPDSYSIHVFSREPLVVYIENFLSLEERKHLLEIRFVVRDGCVEQ